MNAKELRTKSVSELNEELLSLFKAQFSLRMQHGTNQLNKTSELKKMRRSIARVKTILTEKVAGNE